MNNSKENILKRIAAAGMPEYAYPDFGYEPQHFDDPAAMFAQRLRAAGGEAVWLDGATTLDEVVRRCYPDAKSVASALPEVTLATVNPDRVEDPRELVDIDLGSFRGHSASPRTVPCGSRRTSATRRSISAPRR